VSGAPRSNMEITDSAGLARYRRACIVTDLTEAARVNSAAVWILRELAEHDTEDKVCAAAVAAMEDTTSYLADVLTALGDGRLTEAGDRE
jgi:hypothetical protein